MALATAEHEWMPQCTVEPELATQRTADVITILEAREYSLEACLFAIRAFTSIAGSAMKTHCVDGMADFLDDGGCEALVHILHKHSAMSEQVILFFNTNLPPYYTNLLPYYTNLLPYYTNLLLYYCLLILCSYSITVFLYVGHRGVRHRAGHTMLVPHRDERVPRRDRGLRGASPGKVFYVLYTIYY
jgi:hypothetical protein